MPGAHLLFTLITYSIAATATRVCSPTECIKGSTSSTLLSHDAQHQIYLTPGTFPPSTDLSVDELQDLSPTPSLNSTVTAHIGIMLFISFPDTPVFFKNPKYDGSLVPSGAWGSAYLPEGYYALVAPGKALWGAVPDTTQILAASPSSLVTGLVTCGSCASGGVCTRSGNTSSCVCKEGWTGSACDQCAKGFYGTQCTACRPDCSACDDGMSGTGKCIGTEATPAKACNCGHGTCTDSGECTCAAGYVTKATLSEQKCSTCAESFFKDARGNCLACPLGCTTCSLKEGTTDIATCTACVDSLRLSTAEAATCVSAGSCNNGQYYDSSSQSCASCSPACTSCTGPSSTECLSCASPRMNLAGSCVGFSASNGICDSSLSGLQGTFVANNGKQRCDACPAGCASCTLPSYSSATLFSSATCQACNDGYLLESGKCVQTCSEGYFLSETALKNGTCQQCDYTCTACVGASTTCTKCPTPSFAWKGACISLCPSNSVPSNGSCLSCSPDCATCSSTSSSSCLTCPSAGPVLSNGRCLEYCDQSSYFDSSSSTCKTCHSSCAACTGESSSECSLCPEGSFLKSGKCSTASCKHGLVPGLAICLEDLVKTTDNKYLALIALVAIIGIGALAFWLYLGWSTRKTRQATLEFAGALDEREISNRMMILRLEKVLGLDRLRPGPTLPTRLGQDEEESQKTRERKRLKELLLLSKRKREAGQGVWGKDKGKGREQVHKVHGVPLRRHDSIGGEALEGVSKTKDMAVVENDWRFAAPPPPYIPGDSSLAPPGTRTSLKKSEDCERQGGSIRYSLRKMLDDEGPAGHPDWEVSSNRGPHTPLWLGTPPSSSIAPAMVQDYIAQPRATSLRPPPRPLSRLSATSDPTDDPVSKTSGIPSPIFGVLPSSLID